jgi:hypothetical protein
MFEASVDGEAFDMDRWGQYFKPAGMASTGRNADPEADVGAVDTAPKVTAAAPKAEAVETAPWEDKAPAEETKSPSSERAQDILAAIRSRQNKQ